MPLSCQRSFSDSLTIKTNYLKYVWRAMALFNTNFKNDTKLKKNNAKLENNNTKLRK